MKINFGDERMAWLDKIDLKIEPLLDPRHAVQCAVVANIAVSVDWTIRVAQ